MLNNSQSEGAAVWACGTKATSDSAGLSMRDQSIVALSTDFCVPIMQISQIHTTLACTEDRHSSMHAKTVTI